MNEERARFLGMLKLKFLRDKAQIMVDHTGEAFPIVRRYFHPDDGPWAPPLRTRRDYHVVARRTIIMK